MESGGEANGSQEEDSARGENKLLVLRNVQERIVPVIDDCLVIGGN